MQFRLVFLVGVISLVTIVTGCSNPKIVKVAPDTYMLARSDRGGIFGNASAMKADVIREANEFAESQGKIAIPISLEESPLWPGKLASVEYQFRVVDKSDPDAQRTNHILQSNDAKTKEQTNRQKDIHAELIKLDDLRKKGIITDAEFEMQKKKILTTD